MKKFIHVVAVLLCLILLFCGCGTGGGSQSQEDGVLEYDLDSGEDLRLSVSLDLSNGCTVYMGDTKLDKTEFSADGSTLCISSYSLLFLEQGQTYSVRVEADNKNQQFQVKMISASNFSFDDADVCFSYEAPEDVVKAADFGTQTVENIRLGARAYADPSLYSYDAQAKTLTLKKEMLMNLPGETNILVRLSGGKEFSFNLTNTLLAYTDFENPEEIALLTGNYGMFWDATIDQVQQAGGTNVGKVTPQYDHLFVFGDHYWGDMGSVAFEKGCTYQVEFDVKPDDASTEHSLTLYLRKAFESYDPRCGIDPDGEGDDVQKYATVDFTNGVATVDGNMDIQCTYNETTGFTHVTVVFKTSTAYDTIFNCNTGANYYDGDRPGENGLSSAPTNAENKTAYENAKGIIWYFDNLTIVKQN